MAKERKTTAASGWKVASIVIGLLLFVYLSAFLPAHWLRLRGYVSDYTVHVVYWPVEKAAGVF